MRAEAKSRPPLRVEPLHLGVEGDQRGQRRGVVGLVQPGVVDRRLEVQEVRDPAAAGLDPRGALQRGRGEQAKPQAAVGGEVLLRREVVDVRLGDVDVQPAGGRGGVHQDQGACVGAGHTLDRSGHAGGRLVLRPGVDVDAGLGLGRRAGARLGLDDGGVREERRLVGGGGELRAELAEGQVLGLVLHQAEAGNVPERGGPADAEDDLIALGSAEELAEARRGPSPRGSSPAPGGGTCPAAREAAARASICSGRTLDGPAPNRPSLGRRFAGIVMLVSLTVAPIFGWYSAWLGRWPGRVAARGASRFILPDAAPAGIASRQKSSHVRRVRLSLRLSGVIQNRLSWPANVRRTPPGRARQARGTVGMTQGLRSRS